MAALGLVAAVAGCGSEERTPVPTTRYVAIGDSFSSGIDVDPADDRACGRSAANYAHLFSDAEENVELSDVTCGGADPASLTAPQKLVEGQRPPSIDAVAPDTDLVTYSLGANEFLSFGTLVYLCSPLARTDPDGSSCSTGEWSTLPQRLHSTLADRTSNAVLAIRARAPEARVVVVGYPMVFSASGGCADMPMPSGDVDWAVRVNRAWNSGLARGAEVADAEFLDVAALSEGHEACSEAPWINPTSAFTPTDPLSPSASGSASADAATNGAPAHPTARLHEVIAEALGDLWSEPRT